MTRLFCYFTFMLGLALLLVAAPTAEAQKSRFKKAKKEVGKKGPDGLVKGKASGGNADRKMLLDRQQALAQAKNGNGYTGPRYSLAPNKYDTGKGGFTTGEYSKKTKGKKPKKQKQSKKVIDQENPNGKLYQAGLKKRKNKFLFF